MLTLIRWLIARYRKKKAQRTPAQQVDDLLASLRAASEGDLGSMLAVAMQAKKTLDTTRIVDVPFPVDILEGQEPLDDAARERLGSYTRQMRRFQAECIAQGSILSTSVARGLEIWIVTFLTLTLPAKEKGREIWAILGRGAANVEAAYRFINRRDITDLEREYLAYRPLILF